jgi:hypothetical protein
MRRRLTPTINAAKRLKRISKRPSPRHDRPMSASPNWRLSSNPQAMSAAKSSIRTSAVFGPLDRKWFPLGRGWAAQLAAYLACHTGGDMWAPLPEVETLLNSRWSSGREPELH